MANQVLTILRGGSVLLRSIAVISSSIATIISTTLPLFLYTSIPTGYLFSLFIMLTIGAFIIHGVLTHAFNDYADYHSGTDDYSPAILSGGSRVIQKGMIPLHTLGQLGKWLAIVLLIIAVLFAIFAQYELTILLLIGVWAAASYSLPPLRLSYRPFLGEWLSLFPAILFLGFSGPWIILGSIPLWAMQNAVINAFFCLAWVMVHHIPDLEADKQAVPMKRTSVVWFTNKFGLYSARIPALLYLLAAGLCALWIGTDRIWATISLVITIVIAVFFVMKVNVADHQQVTFCEKILLLLAMITAVSLGIFI
ncbi:1,4-dihydroxy-2-naphthoate octaprenyltransferase [Virgibacillus halotolerans]|uniref:prenyltransferase n=1 Tax=Virgibacillus halotolerans TaxID=1071053 RepID=UPI0019614D43|nr:prenyltransferase [Virgibacillus halotolerans]MBM7601257.1 1,4-dihydroxy-2-naphthoate octaprenyltransferase [Virgibacillus halotolerans]